MCVYIYFCYKGNKAISCCVFFFFFIKSYKLLLYVKKIKTKVSSLYFRMLFSFFWFKILQSKLKAKYCPKCQNNESKKLFMRNSFLNKSKKKKKKTFFIPQFAVQWEINIKSYYISKNIIAFCCIKVYVFLGPHFRIFHNHSQ